MKAMNLCDDSWAETPLDSFIIRFINLDSLPGDNIAKKNNFRTKDLTLLKFRI